MLQIAELICTNWRQHEKRRFTFGKLNLVLGNNNDGKTGLMAAIEMGICGRCRYTGDDGRGGNLRTAGADLPWELRLMLPNGHAIIRTEKSLSVSWAQQAGSTRASQLALEEIFNARAVDGVRLAIRGARYFELDADSKEKRKAMLSRILGLDITPEMVIRELSLASEKEELPLLEIAQKHAGYGSSLSMLERAFKKIYDARTGCNRAVIEAKQRLEDLQKAGASLTLIPEAEGKAMAAQEQQLEAEGREFDQRIGRLRAKLSEWDKLRNLVGADLGQQEADQARLASLQDLDVEQLSRQLEEAQQESEWCTRELERHLSFTREQNKLTALMSEIQTHRKVLEGSLTAAGTCQWAPESPCAGAAARQADTKRQMENVQANYERISSQLLQLETPSTSQVELRERIDRASAAIRNGQSALEERRRLQERISQRAGRMTIAEAQAQEEAAERPGVEAALAQLTEERESLASQAAGLREQLRQARSAYEHNGHTSNARKALAALVLEQKCLEFLREFFSPTGLSARLLQDSLTPFTEQLNAILSYFDLAARYDDKLDLAVSRHGGPWLDYNSLSESDKIRVGLAHQVAFAVRSESGIVFVDAIEALDDDGQRDLLAAAAWASERVEGLSHITLLGVRCVEPPPEFQVIDLRRNDG